MVRAAGEIPDDPGIDCPEGKLSGIVLDPTGPRENLGKFFLRNGNGLAIFIEKDRSRTRSALVEGENERHEKKGSGSAAE